MGVARIFSGGGTLLRKFSIRFSKNIQKVIKTNFLKIFKKVKKNFIRKLLKCLILEYFAKHFTNLEFNFCAFGRKMQIVGNFWDNFHKFLKKIAKNALGQHPTIVWDVDTRRISLKNSWYRPLLSILTEFLDGPLCALLIFALLPCFSLINLN